MLPEDPFILVSFVNTKLRDFYKSLDDFCADQGLDRADLEEKLARAGFQYNAETNRFEPR